MVSPSFASSKVGKTFVFYERCSQGDLVSRSALLVAKSRAKSRDAEKIRFLV